MTYYSFFFQRVRKVLFNPIYFILSLSVIFSFCLLALRFMVSGSSTFLFLVWNLFLAGIPLLLSTFLKFVNETRSLKAYVLYPILFLWLLFLPNAPYILTDLFHLRRFSDAPMWLNLMVILSFAWNGLIFGFISIMDVQKIMSVKYSKAVGWFVAVFSLAASSFGIYLGRFLRWNSWDLINEPKHLLYDISGIFLHPLDNLPSLALILSLSIFLILAYSTLCLFSVYKNEQTKDHNQELNSKP